MFKTLLIPVDGSTHSIKALDLAIDLADKYQSLLVILSVYRHQSQFESSHSLVRPRQGIEPPDQSMKQLAEDIVENARQHAEERGAKHVTPVVRRGQPSRSIVQVAKEHGAEAIVMGNRGLGDVSGFLLGSVSHKVASLAECTVITVK